MTVFIVGGKIYSNNGKRLTGFPVKNKPDIYLCTYVYKNHIPFLLPVPSA
jgi:hypothetical protein